MSDDRFKFRVWDKKNSEYVPDGKMCDVHCLLHRDGTLDCGVAYDDGYAGGIDWVETEDAIIEQCTGLTDKNGKLIYEGDIVKTDFGQILAIYFFDGAFKYRWACRNYNFVQMIADDCEVIGNVHEMEVEK